MQKKIENHIDNKCALSSDIYIVHSEGKSNEGVHFSINDRVRVLEIAGDAVLIEKIGAKSNPYCVSGQFLCSISNFTYLEGEEA